jgi:hypothetical protein
MVNSGASFKDVADVLGHKSIATTLIYAKLDMKSSGWYLTATPELLQTAARSFERQQSQGARTK